MTDLHSHILLGMDDGAKDLSSALALLEQAYSQGVDRIALTSHYHCEGEPVEAFLRRREAAFAPLSEAAPGEITLKRGCEVFFSPELLAIDAERLCLEGTNVLLLELPVLQKPAFLYEVLTGLLEQGIVPLIAHAERYVYVRKDPSLLARWICLGARIQVNAGSLLGPDRRRVLKLVGWGLVHVIASDAHSLEHRPANLRSGLDAVAKTQGAEKARELERNARYLFSGKNLPEQKVHVPKKIFGMWI